MEDTVNTIGGASAETFSPSTGSPHAVSDRATFAELASQLDYAMFIVTTASGGERAGCLIGFATQASVDPPRFLACLSVKNRTYRVARHAQVLVVHFVPAQAEELAELFGGRTGDETDKFARVGWRPGPDGAPVLTAARELVRGSHL